MALSPFDLIKRGAQGIVNKGKSFLNTPDNSRSGKIRNTITGIPTAGVRGAYDAYKPLVTKEVPNITREIAQGTARGLGTIGSTVTNATQGKISSEIPQLQNPTGRRAQEILYGKSYLNRKKPISFTSEGRDLLSIINKGKEGTFSGKYVAPALGVTLPLLDAIPGGKGVKTLVTKFGDDVVKAFSKSNDLKFIRSEIEKVGGSIDNIDNLAKDIAKTNDEKTIKSILNTVPIKETKSTDEVFKMKTPPPNVKTRSIKRSDFENTPFRDIGGIADGKSLNMRDAAWSIDNLSALDIAKRGEVGPTVKSFNNLKSSEIDLFKWGESYQLKLENALNKGSKADKKAISEFRRKIPNSTLTQKQKTINTELTKITDAIRNDYNIWAKQTGQEQIGYVDDYLTRKLEPTDNFVGGDRKSFSDSFTKERVGGDLPGIEETDITRILSSYINNVGKKMYLDTPLKQLTDVSGQLRKQGIVKGANFIDEFVKETLNVKQLNRAEKVAQAFIGARSTAALAGNIAWSTLVQPLSLALTFGRNPSAKAATRGLFKGFTKEGRAYAKTLPTYVEKTTQTLSKTGLGDATSGTLRPKIGTMRNKINHYLGLYGDTVEATLSNISGNVAREYGKNLGMKGQALDDYADLMIGATQSEYTKTARPEALRSIWVRLLAPFQTYAFETYRFGKTLVGAPGGGIPIKSKARRFQQATVFISSMVALDWIQSQATGQRKTTVGSFVPLAGPLVNNAVTSIGDSISGERNQYGTGGRTGLSIMDDTKSMTDALGAFIRDGNIQPLRKQFVKWSLGFGGLAGASTVNRLWDGMLANARGYEITRSGDPAFLIEGTDRFVAPILGTYSTKAGKEYIENDFDKISDSEVLYNELKDLPTKERNETLSAIKTHDPNMFNAVIKFGQDTKSGITKDEESIRGLGVQNKERSTAVYNQMETLESDEEKKAYLKDMVAKKVLTESVLKQVLEMKSGTLEPNVPERSKKDLFIDYFKAIPKDPVNALRALTTKEKLGVVEGNLVELQRFYGIDYRDTGGSEEYKSALMKKEGIPLSEKINYKLEHITPVKAGGGTKDHNLLLVSNKDHDSYTPWDIRAGNAVKADRMTRREVTKIAIELKIDKTITVEEAIEKLK